MKIRSRKSTLWQVMVCGVLIDLALIGLSLVWYPSLLNGGRAVTMAVCLLLLLLYGCLGVALPLRASPIVMTALWAGMVFGLLIGVVFIVDIIVEDFIDLGSQASTFSTLGFMFFIFLLFAGAGTYGTYKTGQFRLGLLASIWSAMLGVLIVVLVGFTLSFLFMQRMEYILASDYLQSGMSNRQAFTFFNALDSASTHLLEAPILATVFGSLGGLLMKSLNVLRGRHSLSAKGN